jgi:hypothetical protein
VSEGAAEVDRAIAEAQPAVFVDPAHARAGAVIGWRELCHLAQVIFARMIPLAPYILNYGRKLRPIPLFAAKLPLFTGLNSAVWQLRGIAAFSSVSNGLRGLKRRQNRGFSANSPQTGEKPQYRPGAKMRRVHI